MKNDDYSKPIDVKFRFVYSEDDGDVYQQYESFVGIKSLAHAKKLIDEHSGDMSLSGIELLIIIDVDILDDTNMTVAQQKEFIDYFYEQKYDFRDYD